MLRSELHGHRHSRTDCRLQVFTNNQYLSTQCNHSCSRFEPRVSALSLGARTSTEFSSCIHPTSRAPDLETRRPKCVLLPPSLLLRAGGNNARVSVCLRLRPTNVSLS